MEKALRIGKNITISLNLFQKVDQNIDENLNNLYQERLETAINKAENDEFLKVNIQDDTNIFFNFFNPDITKNITNIEDENNYNTNHERIGFTINDKLTNNKAVRKSFYYLEVFNTPVTKIQKDVGYSYIKFLPEYLITGNTTATNLLKDTTFLFLSEKEYLNKQNTYYVRTTFYNSKTGTVHKFYTDLSLRDKYFRINLDKETQEYLHENTEELFEIINPYLEENEEPNDNKNLAPPIKTGNTRIDNTIVTTETIIIDDCISGVTAPTGDTGGADEIILITTHLPNAFNFDYRFEGNSGTTVTGIWQNNVQVNYPLGTNVTRTEYADGSTASFIITNPTGITFIDIDNDAEGNLNFTNGLDPNIKYSVDKLDRITDTRYSNGRTILLVGASSLPTISVNGTPETLTNVDGNNYFVDLSGTTISTITSMEGNGQNLDGLLDLKIFEGINTLNFANNNISSVILPDINVTSYPYNSIDLSNNEITNINFNNITMYNDNNVTVDLSDNNMGDTTVEDIIFEINDFVVDTSFTGRVLDIGGNNQDPVSFINAITPFSTYAPPIGNLSNDHWTWNGFEHEPITGMGAVYDLVTNKGFTVILRSATY